MGRYRNLRGRLTNLLLAVLLLLLILLERLTLQRWPEETNATEGGRSTEIVNKKVDTAQQEGIESTVVTLFVEDDNRSATNYTFDGVVARPFPFYNLSLPCFVAEEDWMETSTLETPTKEGFMFVKPYKVGSSTVAGVQLRVARNEAMRRGVAGDICKARFDHVQGPAFHLFHNRAKARSLLWTTIRDPTKRIISEFFHFQVSRRGVEPTDDNFLSFLKRKGPNYYLRSLDVTRRFSSDDPVSSANNILDEYDFIAITERMDESLVAFSMLAHIPLTDFLHLNAKRNGNYDAQNPCVFIHKSFLTPVMQEFFISDEWQEQVRWDLALYLAANRSLDLSIEQLGRDNFDQRLTLFRSMQQAAEDKCLSSTVFPCNADGVFRHKTDCMWKDSGCGQDCLDTIGFNFT